MAIDYGRLRNVNARKVTSALLRDGFSLRHQKGSHRRFVHPDGRRTSISPHGTSDTFTRKTLKSIIEQTGWTENDLHRLGLLTHH